MERRDGAAPVKLCHQPDKQWVGGNQSIAAAEQQAAAKWWAVMTAAVSGLEFLNFDIAVQPLFKRKKEREVF